MPQDDVPRDARTDADRPRTLRVPYTGAAAGPAAVLSSLRYAKMTSGPLRGAHVFLRVNQRDGFDCPGCAWPDPDHRSVAEFCENGARAVAHEADNRKVDAAFFARHGVAELRRQTDHELEHHGRLVEPMVLRPGATHYTPISWEDSLSLVRDELRALASPDEAVFYTSGRASNEAAFLYQLFVRAFGTNNLPDCSNMCHESSGVGLGATIGIGKGTVLLDDFALADCIFVIGQNPGTNHPRMLSTLADARRRGAAIISVNPLKERALEVFAHPQKGLGILGQGTAISSQYVQVRIGGDVAFLKGVMKVVLEAQRTSGGALDERFLAEHCTGVDELLASIDAASWDDIVASSGVARADIEAAGKTYLAAKRTIVCWAMGLTQHKHAVDNIKEVVHLLALRGNLGRPGAGVCPVRGHSNVQGDRTVGINERPTEDFLARLDAACGMHSPRKPGYDVVDAIAAMERGDAKVFIALGGNFAAATPDSPRTARALGRCSLTVQISTKLNRSHVEPGRTALILPCLGRSELDVQAGKEQLVTVENSMGIVHKSHGRLAPAGAALRSEPRIVAELAAAVLGEDQPVRWRWLADDYDRVRDLIERAIPGFDDYNTRVRTPDGFLLPNGPRERRFATKSGKVELGAVPLPRLVVDDGQLVMMTIRTHDQFNTTVYQLDDRYRGIYGERRVVLVHPDDARARGLVEGASVDVTSHYAGERRTVRGFLVVPYDIPRGNAAMYFPEANALVPLESKADLSGTPTSKSVLITLARAQG